MPKKCLICSETAQYVIKDSSDFYCMECAEEHFGDLSLLIKLEESAKCPAEESPEKAEELEYEDEEF